MATVYNHNEAIHTILYSDKPSTEKIILIARILRASGEIHPDLWYAILEAKDDNHWTVG